MRFYQCKIHFLIIAIAALFTHYASAAKPPTEKHLTDSSTRVEPLVVIIVQDRFAILNSNETVNPEIQLELSWVSSMEYIDDPIELKRYGLKNCNCFFLMRLNESSWFYLPEKIRDILKSIPPLVECEEVNRIKQ